MAGLLPNPGRARGPPVVRPPGPPPPYAFSGSDSLAPRETLDHSGFLSFHRGNNPRPGRGGGTGKMGRIVGKKENSCVNINYFLKHAHPTPQKKGSSRTPEERAHVEQTMFPQLGGAGRGRGPTRAGGPSSRSPRAERRRRRKWRRRRGRCSRLGQEPCQENTSSQRSPPIPAAARTGAGPPALLPPRSPRLGPIVWLGARAREDGTAARERERERGKQQAAAVPRPRGREGGREGALR